MMRRIGFMIVFLAIMIGTGPALAHADLLRADPPPDAMLESAPAEIRLVFSEPLNADLSRVTLRAAGGVPVETPPAEADPNDKTVIIVRPGDLPDGLYTVSWEAVSSSNGHLTKGSYTFTIGASAATNHNAKDNSGNRRLTNLLPAPTFSGDAPVKLFAAHDGAPYLLTADGHLLLPGPDDSWQPAPFDARVNEVYSDVNGGLWVAADSGLYYDDGSRWQPVDDQPAAGLEVTHGYVFAFNHGSLGLMEQGGTAHKVRHLNTPLPEATPSELVMLGDHSHALLLDGEVFRSLDLGLSWTPLATPVPVSTIAVDADGKLLAAAETGLYTWNRVDGTWSAPQPLPAGGVPVLRVLSDRLYALAGGRLYVRAGGAWQPVDVPGDGYLTALEVQYPATLWALDASGRRVLSSTDGTAWTAIPVKIPQG
ncbi:MAG: copper resistance protein CopC [Chloroflexi bacterium]|nr:copper resistance protein CopC [Chloroflexota bacterium]